jgi:proteasome assembly chaperone 3
MSSHEQHYHNMSIPALSVNIHGMDIGSGVENGSFPAQAKQASGLVNGVQTEVCSVYFADKILITISQAGRLSQWVCASRAPCYYCILTY